MNAARAARLCSTFLGREAAAVKGVGQMTLRRGRFIGYEFDRMVMLFSMVDG